jgi:hypothetical protein
VNYTDCFLKNAANRNSVIYCPILINNKSNEMVKKHFTMDTFFIFTTLIIMSNKCQVSFYFEMETFIFILVENFFLISMMSNTLTFVE